MNNEELSVSLIRRPMAGKYKIIFTKPDRICVEVEQFDDLEKLIERIGEIQKQIPSYHIISIDKIEATYDIKVD